MALTDNLVAWWDLDEASGTRADAVGSNDLTDNNTVLAGTGKSNNAADFETSNSESLSIADNADLSTESQDWSFAGWIKPESIAADMAISSKRSGAAFEWQLIVQSADSKVKLSVNTAGGVKEATSTAALSVDTWYFVTCGHDRANDVVWVSVNAATKDTAATGNSETAASAAAFALGVLLTQGYFDGLIDEAGFWKKVLSDAEIDELYNGGDGFFYPFATELAATLATTGAMTAIISPNKYKLFSANVPKTSFRTRA